MNFFKRAKPRLIMEEEILERKEKQKSIELLSDAIVCRKSRKMKAAPVLIDADSDDMSEHAPNLAAEPQHTYDDAPLMSDADLFEEATAVLVEEPVKPVEKPRAPIITEEGRRAVGSGGSMIDRAVRAAELSKPTNRDWAA